MREVRSHNQANDPAKRHRHSFARSFYATFCVQRVTQACLVSAVRRDVSVCTGLRVTTSREGVSAPQGGEENSVTKV